MGWSGCSRGTPSSPAADGDPLPKAIEVVRLTKRFGSLTAVDGATFSVRRNEIFGLVGPDGAGKTTLMRVLAGVLPADSGEACVAGCDVIRSPEDAKRRIGYLPQSFSLYSDLTVMENIGFVRDLFLAPAGDAKARAAQLLDLTGLAPFSNRLAGRLSGGMKQKLALICALVHRPEVILLDEPTTGVDPISRRDFWEIIAALPSEGVTVVLTSPYMDEAARCHRLALMAEGRVLAEGSRHDLCRRVGGSFFEVDAPDARRAAGVLAGLPGLISLAQLGDAVRVHLDDAAGGSEAVEGALVAAGVQFRGIARAEASLEDAFVQLSLGGARNG